MTDTETAWLAGLLEGEGSFLSWKQKDARSGNRTDVVRIQMSTSDKDVLVRAAEIVGVGRVKPLPYHPDRLGKKPMWIWTVQAKADVRELALRLLPWLGSRRSQQVARIVELTDNIAIRPDGQCRNGHLIDENNRRRTGIRADGSTQYTCLRCDRERRRSRASASRPV